MAEAPSVTAQEPSAARFIGVRLARSTPRSSDPAGQVRRSTSWAVGAQRANETPPFGKPTPYERLRAAPEYMASSAMAICTPVASSSTPVESYIPTATWPVRISGIRAAVRLSVRRATASFSSGWAASTAAGSPLGSRVRVATDPPVTASASTARPPSADQCSRHVSVAGSTPAGTDDAGHATRSASTMNAFALVRSGAAPARDVRTEIWWVART